MDYSAHIPPDDVYVVPRKRRSKWDDLIAALITNPGHWLAVDFEEQQAFWSGGGRQVLQRQYPGWTVDRGETAKGVCALRVCQMADAS